MARTQNHANNNIVIYTLAKFQIKVVLRYYQFDDHSEICSTKVYKNTSLFFRLFTKRNNF